MKNIIATTALFCMLSVSLPAFASFFSEMEDDDDIGIFQIGVEGEFFSQSTNVVEFDSIEINNFHAQSFPLTDDMPDNDWGY